MSRARFETRLQCLEWRASTQQVGIPHVWRWPDKPMRRLSRGVRSPLATSPSRIPRALATRLARLAHASIPPRKGCLQVFRYRQETETEALSRYGIAAAEWPQVHIRPWVGRAELPAPGWISTTWTPQDPAYVEQRARQANERIMRVRRGQTVG